MCPRDADDFVPSRLMPRRLHQALPEPNPSGAPTRTRGFRLQAEGRRGKDVAAPWIGPSSTSTVRVRYAETDKMGVVYYANYFVWFEVARADLLRSLGWSYREMERTGVSLPVIEAHCEYIRGARYDDELDVQTRGRLLSPVRMEFSYTVINRADATVAASGRTVHAAVTAEGRPCRLPEQVRQVFAS
jgi:acyl-CoA thioester hydrolase